MSHPLISVIMSTYNDAKYLNYSIESILNQSLDKFEFLIIDDGSNDSTPRILDEYACNDERIKLITIKSIASQPFGVTHNIGRGFPFPFPNIGTLIKNRSDIYEILNDNFFLCDFINFKC